MQNRMKLNNLWGFQSKGWKSRHVIQEIFTRETMKTRKAKNVFEAKFGSGEIMSSWETDDRRGDYLLYLHLLASTFLARALSFPFCIRLDDVFRYEEKLFKLSWSFQSSICHKVVIFSGITEYFLLRKMKFVLVHFHPASRTIWIDWYSKSNINVWFDKIKYIPWMILLHK